jgi:hypothetical protein
VSSVNRKLLPVIVLAGIVLFASLAATVAYLAALISAMWTS